MYYQDQKRWHLQPDCTRIEVITSLWNWLQFDQLRRIMRYLWQTVAGPGHCVSPYLHPRGGGGGGTPDFKWWRWSNGGKNQNPKKSLGLPTKPQKNPWTKQTGSKQVWLCFKKQNYTAGIRGHYHESSDCFKCPRKFLLKSSYPKKYLPNFPTQKNPVIANFKPQKILQSSPSLEIWSTPPRPPGSLFLSLGWKHLYWR